MSVEISEHKMMELHSRYLEWLNTYAPEHDSRDETIYSDMFVAWLAGYKDAKSEEIDVNVVASIASIFGYNRVC